jgi:hypothetical protein
VAGPGGGGAAHGHVEPREGRGEEGRCGHARVWLGLRGRDATTVKLRQNPSTPTAGRCDRRSKKKNSSACAAMRSDGLTRGVSNPLVFSFHFQFFPSC